MLQKIYNAFAPSVILMLPRMFYRGLILYFCWIWFIVPIFGLPIIPLWEAITIGGAVSLLTFEQIGLVENTNEAWLILAKWCIGATVFFVAAFVMHLMR